MKKETSNKKEEISIEVIKKLEISIDFKCNVSWTGDAIVAPGFNLDSFMYRNNVYKILKLNESELVKNYIKLNPWDRFNYSESTGHHTDKRLLEGLDKIIKRKNFKLENFCISYLSIDLMNLTQISIQIRPIEFKNFSTEFPKENYIDSRYLFESTVDVNLINKSIDVYRV